MGTRIEEIERQMERYDSRDITDRYTVDLRTKEAAAKEAKSTKTLLWISAVAAVIALFR